MRRIDLMLAGLCVAWLASLLLITAAARDEVLTALGTEHAADWASATATFLAVCAALGIAVWESVRAERQEERRRRDARIKPIKTLIVLGIRVGATAGLLDQICKDGTWDSETEVAHRHAVATLSAQVDALAGEVTSPEFAKAISRLSIGAMGLLQILDLILAEPAPFIPPEGIFEKTVERLNRVSGLIKDIAVKEMVDWD